jgi:thiol-disulfide isomerase/thioredoxin
MKRAILLISIGILVFLVTNSFSSTQMPQFELPDAINGEKVSSSSFEGKTLLLTFFATWCPPCLEEVPTLIQLQNEYRDDNFSVIGLSVDQGGARAVKRLIEKKSINYPVVMADSQIMEDFGGVYGIPVAFLINKKGNVVKKYTGYVPKSILEKDLKKIL